MTWNATHLRWKKKYHGEQYVVSCRQLELPPDQHTRLGSLEAANDWWRKKLSELHEQGEIYDQRTLGEIECELEYLRGQWGEGELTYDQLDKKEAPLLRERQKLLGGRLLTTLHDYRKGIVSGDDLALELEKVAIDKALADTATDSLDQAIDEYIGFQRTRAKAAQIAPQRFHVYQSQIELFRAWVQQAGHTSVSAITASLLEDYCQHLLGKIKSERDGKGLSPAYAKGVMDTVKQFARRCFQRHLIELPRNLIEKYSLRIKIPKTKPQPATIAQIKSLLKTADERLRLYFLLMLNCGAYQSDIGELRRDQYENGHLTRKRTKMEECESVPTVTYRLWKTTDQLLRKHMETSGEWLLLNSNGEQLWRSWIGDDGKAKVVDNIASKYKRLVKDADRPTLKQLRKTSSNLLFNNKQFKNLHTLFLGHSPRTVAEINYVDPDDDTLDEAIEWLGEQYGIK
jgi:integrase